MIAAPEKDQRLRLKRVGITCVCFNMRKAARLVTRHYDAFLEPTGLTSTQFSVLATIARHEHLAISRLAEQLVTDRTTLTRNLKPLEKSRLIQYDRGDDRRSRVVALTAAGWQALENAMPLWERAQESLLSQIGDTNTRGLLANLWRFVYGKRYLGA